MAINYLRRVQARYQGQGQSDVSRGIAAGEAVGKLLGGLGDAIKGAQKDALANKLMNTEDAPRAALVSTGGPQPGGPQPAGVDSGDPNADLSTDLPENVSQSVGGSAPILNQAIAAQQLSGSPGTVDPNADLSTDLPDIVSPTQSVQVPASPSLGINTDAPASTAYSGTGTDPALASNVAAAQLSNAQPSAQSATRPAMAPGVSTAGTAPHTGGVAEMELMQKMQQMQAAKASAGSAQQEAALRLQDLKDKAAGTGNYSTEGALKRAQLLKAQADAIAAGKPDTVKVDKNAPPANFNGEPVTDDNQLNNFVDKQYGAGTSTAITNLISDGSGADAAAVKGADGKPVIDPLTGQPKIASNLSVPLSKNQSGAVTKSANVSLPDLQTIVRQKNALRKKQGLSLYRVPGEDQSLGTITNPYPITSKLDMASRASGTYARLNGQTYRVP